MTIQFTVTPKKTGNKGYSTCKTRKINAYTPFQAAAVFHDSINQALNGLYRVSDGRETWYFKASEEMEVMPL